MSHAVPASWAYNTRYCSANYLSHPCILFWWVGTAETGKSSAGKSPPLSPQLWNKVCVITCTAPLSTKECCMTRMSSSCLESWGLSGRRHTKGKGTLPSFSEVDNSNTKTAQKELSEQRRELHWLMGRKVRTQGAVQFYAHWAEQEYQVPLYGWWAHLIAPGLSSVLSSRTSV